MEKPWRRRQEQEENKSKKLTEVNKKIAELTYTENQLFKQDQDFLDFSDKKNNLESTYYNIKNLIQNKNLTNNDCEGKNIMTCLQEIENQLNDNQNKIFDLTPIEESLNKIMLSITPSNVDTEKQKMMNEVNDYRKRIDDGKVRLDEKGKTDAVNMLEFFKLFIIFMLFFSLNNQKNGICNRNDYSKNTCYSCCYL